MYTEEYEKRSFSLTNFLLKILLIAVIVLLLILFLPKYLSPIFKNNSKTNCNGYNCDTSSIKALKSEVFGNNIDKMKEAAISYYTDDKLPQEIEQSKKMTLSNMIDENIIEPLTDKNNKDVDIEKSYVQITKLSDEYILKVNLKDSENEDYILVHLGCYSYCDSYICEKRPGSTIDNKSAVSSTVPIKGSMSDGIYFAPSSYEPIVKNNGIKTCSYDSYNGKFYDSKGNSSSKLSYLKSCLKPICKKVSSYYFDMKGNNVSYSDYLKSCSQGNNIKTYKCNKVNGYYYDSNGNIVSYEKYKNSCDTNNLDEEKYSCKIVNGNYYNYDGFKVSKIDYIKSCKHPVCEKVSSYYFGLDGDVVSESQFNKECGITIPQYDIDSLYEYSKTSGSELSDWSNWSNWNKTSCDTQSINCSDNDITCLRKVQLYRKSEQSGLHQKTYSKTRKQFIQIGSYTKKLCSNYEYVEINSLLYITNSNYNLVNSINRSTTSTVEEWKYNGRDSYSNIPKEDERNHYIFIGADYSYCGDTCSSLPNYYYDSYTYTGNLDIVNSSSDEIRCDSYEVKTIPVYRLSTITEKATRSEPLYEDVCYEREKTRNLADHGTTKYKWSTYNDLSLLNNGWNYTGNKKAS